MEIQYGFKQSFEKLVEKILDDDAVMINHMILNKGDYLPEHHSNSNIYMIVVRGSVTLQLSDHLPKQYGTGNIINIPFDVKMNVSNSCDEQLEFFVIKAPSPRIYQP